MPARADRRSSRPRGPDGSRSPPAGLKRLPSTTDPRAAALKASLIAESRKAPVQDVLAGMLAASKMDRRDRRLAEEIALGSLRRRQSLDLALSFVSSRRPEKTQNAVLEAMRHAAYQVLFLDRVPAHAAVDSAVRLVSEAVGPAAAGFANGVLRSLSRLVKRKGAREPERDEVRSGLYAKAGAFTVLDRQFLPEPEADPAAFLSGRYGYPRWMVERWLSRFGRGRTERILQWGDEVPALCVRLNPLRTKSWPLSAGEAARVFRGAGSCEPGEVAGTYLIKHGEHNVSPGELPGLADGLFTIQDETQARAVLLLDPPPGARVLDMCAGPGGKATHIAERVGEGGKVAAMDADRRRLEMVRDAARRLGLEQRFEFVEGDAREVPPQDEGAFEYILLDAPCSNMGALDRRPEVRFRASQAVLRERAGLQRELLAAALMHLAPGGRLVYSVCSFEEEETEGPVRGALEGRPDAILEAELLVLPEPSRRDGGYFAAISRREAG